MNSPISDSSLKRQEKVLSDNRKNKLGLNWAKLSFNWNWALLWLRFATLHWWLPITITYPELNKPVNLVTSTYLHTRLLTCMLACLLTFLYTYQQRRPNSPLQTVNSNCPKSHISPPLNFHRLYFSQFQIYDILVQVGWVSYMQCHFRGLKIGLNTDL